MKVLLQHAKTRLFWEASGQWTGEVDQAFDFRSSAAAIFRAYELHLEPVEVLFWFGDHRYDLTLPLKSGRSGPGAATG